MSKCRGSRNGGLQGLEYLEDRRVLSAGGLKDWLASALPLAPDVPVAASSPSVRDDDAVAGSSDHKQGDADSSGIFASLHTMQVALLTEIEALGRDSVARIFAAPTSSSESLGAVQEKNKSGNDANVGTSEAGASLATHAALVKDLYAKIAAALKQAPTAAHPKATSAAEDKDDAVTSHAAPSSAAAAVRAIVAVETELKRLETPADQKDDTAERNGFLLAAQHHQAAAADGSPEATAAFGAFSAPDASLVARNSSDEMARNLRAYTTQDANQLLPGWIAVDLSRDTEPADQLAAALFSEAAGGSVVALSDTTEGLVDFAPAPGAALDVDLDRLLSQVGSLGRQLGDSLAGNDLARWLLALTTASAAVAVVRQQRRRASAPLGLCAADHTTWTLAALPEPFSTATDP